jgi:hypothetical protein
MSMRLSRTCRTRVARPVGVSTSGIARADQIHRLIPDELFVLEQRFGKPVEPVAVPLQDATCPCVGSLQYLLDLLVNFAGGGLGVLPTARDLVAEEDMLAAVCRERCRQSSPRVLLDRRVRLEASGGAAAAGRSDRKAPVRPTGDTPSCSASGIPAAQAGAGPGRTSPASGPESIMMIDTRMTFGAIMDTARSSGFDVYDARQLPVDPELSPALEDENLLAETVQMSFRTAPEGRERGIVADLRVRDQVFHLWGEWSRVRELQQIIGGAAAKPRSSPLGDEPGGP